MILHPNNDEYCPTCHQAMFSEDGTPRIAECTNGHKFLRVNAFATIDNIAQEGWSAKHVLDRINKALLHE